MEHDTFNVVPGTPQKIKPKVLFAKTYKPRKRKRTIPCHEQEHIIVRNEIKLYSSLPKSLEEGTYNKYKNPHVFYEVKEILFFSEKSQPENPNIKSLGIFTKDNGRYFLLEPQPVFFTRAPLRLVININLLLEIPNSSDILEVYGFIVFTAVGMPFFVVKFWNSFKSCTDKYLKLLLLQKQHVPDCYKKLTKHTPDSIIHTNNETNYFEEVDESHLNNHAEYLEQIYLDIEQMMSMSIE